MESFFYAHKCGIDLIQIKTVILGNEIAIKNYCFLF